MSRIPLPFAVGDVSALAKSLRSQMDSLGRIPSHLELLNMLARAGGRRNFQHLRADPLDARAAQGVGSALPDAPDSLDPAQGPEALGASPGGSEQHGAVLAETPLGGGYGVEAAPREAEVARAGMGAAPAAPVRPDGQNAPAAASATNEAGETVPPGARNARDAAAQARRFRRLTGYFDAQGRLIRWPGKHSHREPCLWALWARVPAGRDMDEPGVNEVIRQAHLFGDHALLRRELFDHGLLARTPDGRVYRRVERAPGPEALELIRDLAARTAG
ncbi:hypothetical protein NNJEOMEG_03005 [Fundidesulfovibrio magnetotacticus]|uniref:DUF2087 domain-containing protein n=1 Tax=Fundidesulfovibrio magnetotacticus TaxID=2730080 RepID=A0A6V8LZU5_9BACT|nr:DUF2087 domain-containing protein [Fundidesulfovibrio magnetotacticus]GFK95147.1 hypothetical protein NNJEOMEG_03005 [Fundidesulfovibrio magnetotacticus]